MALPDWWTLRRFAEAPSLGVLALAPATMGTLMAGAKPYLGLTDGQFLTVLASPEIRHAFYCFLAAAGLWLFTVAAVFVSTPRPLRGQATREAAIEAFKRAGGLPLEDGATLTHIAWIDRSAITWPFGRGLILTMMILSGLACFAGIASILRALHLLPV